MLIGFHSLSLSPKTGHLGHVNVEGAAIPLMYILMQQELRGVSVGFDAA